MKRRIAVFLILLMTLSLAACGSAGGEKKTEIDLTAMSGTMVYTEVYNMLSTPENYIGKTVKMTGIFTTGKNNKTGEMYFFCLVADATACCKQGIEFVLKGKHTYPDDYPKAGEQITVVGSFNTYMEGENQYCHLENAEIL